MAHPQDEAHHDSLESPEAFWGKQAEYIHWHKRPSSVLKKSIKTLKSGASHHHWEWFDGGEISTCYNCVDRHIIAGNGDKPAIFYDSPVTKTKQSFSYKELLEEVEVLAGALREEGVRKGDVVLVYSKFSTSHPSKSHRGSRRTKNLSELTSTNSAHDPSRSHRYPGH